MAETMPGRHGRLEPEGAAERYDPLALLDRVRVAESREREALRINLYDREVGFGVPAHKPRLQFAPIRELHPDLVGAAGHVVVSQYITVGADDDARPGPPLRSRRIAEAGEARYLRKSFGDARRRSRLRFFDRINVDHGRLQLLCHLSKSARQILRRRHLLLGRYISREPESYHAGNRKRQSKRQRPYSPKSAQALLFHIHLCYPSKTALKTWIRTEESLKACRHLC